VALQPHSLLLKISRLNRDLLAHHSDDVIQQWCCQLGHARLAITRKCNTTMDSCLKNFALSSHRLVLLDRQVALL
jgi:hypothetical protein